MTDVQVFNHYVPSVKHEACGGTTEVSLEQFKVLGYLRGTCAYCVGNPEIYEMGTRPGFFYINAALFPNVPKPSLFVETRQIPYSLDLTVKDVLQTVLRHNAGDKIANVIQNDMREESYKASLKTVSGLKKVELFWPISAMIQEPSIKDYLMPVVAETMSLGFVVAHIESGGALKNDDL